MPCKRKGRSPGRIPERLFVRRLERALGSCRGFAPFAGEARSHNPCFVSIAWWGAAENQPGKEAANPAVKIFWRYRYSYSLGEPAISRNDYPLGEK